MKTWSKPEIDVLSLDKTSSCEGVDSDCTSKLRNIHPAGTSCPDPVRRPVEDQSVRRNNK